MFTPLLAAALAPATVSDASFMERRLWEVAIRRFEAEDAETTYPEDSILFYGSSSIRLWRNIVEDMAPYPVIQRGYGGARLSDGVGFVERVVHPHQFKALGMFFGNDITGKSGDRSPEGVAELFRETLGKVRAKFPETPVLWVEITPTPARFAHFETALEANELIRRVCEEDPNAYYLSARESYLRDGQPKAELFQEDGLHQNDAGYAIWREMIRNALFDIIGPPENSALEVVEDEVEFTATES